MFKELKFVTHDKEEVLDITEQVQAAVAESGIDDGFVFIYIPHASAAISIHGGLEKEEAPKLDRILEAANPDREASHYTKAAFVAPTEVGIVKGGRMLLGEDQRVYFYEFDGPRERRVYLYLGS